jgi:hypothetical protein
MEISHIPRRYTSSPATITSTVSGPLAFIKLALEELKVPFVYFKRGLKVRAGTGASFTVQHFDINDTNMINHLRAVHRADYFPLEEPDTNQHANGNETYLQILPSSFKKDQWLIAKHIAPINEQERDMIELDENYSKRNPLSIDISRDENPRSRTAPKASEYRGYPRIYMGENTR